MGGQGLWKSWKCHQQLWLAPAEELSNHQVTRLTLQGAATTAAPSSRGTGTGSQSKNIVMHHGISKMIAGMDRGPRRGFMGQALEADHTHTDIYIYIATGQ